MKDADFRNIFLVQLSVGLDEDLQVGCREEKKPKSQIPTCMVLEIFMIFIQQVIFVKSNSYCLSDGSLPGL